MHSTTDVTPSSAPASGEAQHAGRRVGFRLPDVGEGLTEADIVEWKVRVGDSVSVNQPLVDIETAKAIVELPSPYSGVVVGLKGAVGETIPVGDVIVEFELEAPAGVPSPRSAGPDEAGTSGTIADGTVTDGTGSGGGSGPVLVGYGVSEARTGRRARKGPASEPAAGPGPIVKRVGPVLAKPPVRLYARQHGVDLATVSPTGPGGTVSRVDVDHALAGRANQGGGPHEQRIPIKGVMRAMADAMSASAFSAPHVTEWLTVDVSRAVSLIESLRSHPEWEGVRVTPLALASRALVRALARTPMGNGRWDEAGGCVVIPAAVNIGIATATERGLLVPTVYSAQEMNLRQLAMTLAEVVGKAREGRATPADLSGATTTITNVGVFGVDGGTPIIPPGQAAILCLGQIAKRPWVVGDQVVARDVMTLTLSFDHRFVDGSAGSAILADVGAFMSDPAPFLVG